MKVKQISGLVSALASKVDKDVEVIDTNGFPPEQRTNTIMSVDENLFTFTISHNSGGIFHYFVLGERYEATTVTIPFTSLEGNHWFYFDETGLKTVYNPTALQIKDVILKYAFVSTIYWNATNNKVVIDIQDERHGTGMAPVEHYYNHRTRGSQFISGFSLGNILTEQLGNLATHVQFSVASGEYVDEDISHFLLSNINVNTAIPIVYLSGDQVTPNLRSDTCTISAQSFPVLTNKSTSGVYYNQLTGGNYQLTEVPNNGYCLYHIYTFNGQNTRVISIMGQSSYTSIIDARSAASTEISNLKLRLPLPEIIPVGTVLVQTRNALVTANNITWSKSSNLVTVTSNNHGLVTGATITVVSGESTNVTKIITVVSENIFTYTTGNGTANGINLVYTVAPFTNAVFARFRNIESGKTYTDWRTTELAQGANPSSHYNLSDVLQAGLGVGDGHIGTGTQTIYGTKIFFDNALFNGTINIAGNIYQNGSIYETHAEQLYTTKDIIITRDGATTGLLPGQYTGIQAKLYDDVNDGLLVFDRDGYALVGDVGNLVRIAAITYNPTNNYFARYNSTTKVFDTVVIASADLSDSSNIAKLNGIQSFTGSNTFTQQIISTLIGSAAFSISSNIMISNLNADLLDGNHASAFYLATNPNGYTSNIGTVTSVASGNGLNFTTITSSGSITLGTPSSISSSSTNSVSTNSHTHAIDSTIITTTGSQILTNKTLTDSTTFFQDETDNTKKLQFQLSSITTATTRTLTIPNASGIIALTSDLPTVNNGTLTLAVSGSGLSGSSSFTANQSGASTFTVTSNATNLNTVSTIVFRDASGNFSAGTITAALNGNASTATILETARTINGVSFNGSANITIAANTTNTLTIGTGLSGTSFNGSSAVTISLTAITAGDATVGAVKYNGTTNTTGQFYGGTTNPTGSTRLNYSGYFYPTYLNLTASADTATAATHYYVETGSDGYVRPKTLDNVKSEIVTKVAVEAVLTGVLTSHTHNYLPLTGGTLSNRLTIDYSATGGDGTWVNSGILIKNNNATVAEAAIAFQNISTTTNYWITGINQGTDYKIAYGTGFEDVFTKLALTTTGNLGLGTTLPKKPLHIYSGTTASNIAGTDYRGLLITDSTYPRIILENTTEAVNAKVFDIIYNNTYLQFRTLTDDSGSVYTDNILTLGHTGNVGIGTVTPLSLLNIKDISAANVNGQKILTLESTYSAATIGSGSSIIFKSQSGTEEAANIRSYTFGSLQTGLAFGTGWNNVTTKMVIDNIGKVGIGTVIPEEKISIDGNIAFGTNANSCKIIHNSTTNSIDFIII